MFSRPVTIIVGAGAGFEYRMPLGMVLASEIAGDVAFQFEHFSSNPTKGDPELFNILFRKYQSERETLNRFTISGNELSSVLSAAVSIDDALYQLGENPEAITLGKMCIIRSILKAESRSSLAFVRGEGRLSPDAGRDGWIEQLFSMATTGLRKSELHKAFDKVTFINFNYDRCIEHYLFWSFQRIGIDASDGASIVSKLKMIRPYGGIGSALPGTQSSIAFGYQAVDPFNLLDRIRTYTEVAIHDSSEMQNALLHADLIVFLGFGFHRQNLDLLETIMPQKKHVMATVKKIHHANLVDLTNALHRTLRVGPELIELYDMTAPELLRDLRLKIEMRTSV
jgi:hypothetical protein